MNIQIELYNKLTRKTEPEFVFTVKNKNAGRVSKNSIHKFLIKKLEFDFQSLHNYLIIANDKVIR